jgi:hypothetical protein
MFSTARIPTVLLAGALMVCGCTTHYQLNMSASLSPNDETVISPKLSEKKYSRIMVIPPSGTARGQYDKEIALFEREFLKSGITVISGAITGRVVLDAEGGKSKSESAAQLSDAERALIMAKETGADAILQIGQFEWNEGQTRYYLADPGSGSHKEVNLAAFRASNENKISFPSQYLTFVGRLTDVQTGTILASFKIVGATNWNLPMDYNADIVYVQAHPNVLKENFDYVRARQVNGQYLTSRPWENEAKERTVSSVIQQVAKRVIGS